MQRAILGFASRHIAKIAGQNTGRMFEQAFIEFIRGQLARQLAPMVEAAVARIQFESQLLQPMAVTLPLLRKKRCDGLAGLSNTRRLKQLRNIQL